MSGYEVHEHSYTSGPNAGGRYRDGQWSSGKFAHSHEGGDVPHSHPHTGPAYFGRRKLTKRPYGPQLEYIAHTPEQNTFRVIFVNEYTDAHASAGISRERWERNRAAFLAIAAGSDEYESLTADARMVSRYRLTPIYELSKPQEDRHAAVQ